LRLRALLVFVDPCRQNDTDLRAGEWGQILLERWRVIPRRHVRDAGRAAANRDLAAPATHLPADLLEPLPASGVREARRSVVEGGLERRGVAPPVPVASGMHAAQRSLEAQTQVHDADDHYLPAEPFSPVVRLRGDPPLCPRMLDNVLTHLRQDHAELERFPE